VLEVHGDRMVKRTFDPGFRIARHQNDLNLAPTAARQMGASPPNTADPPGVVQRLCGAWRKRMGPLR
jgi:2-hydroxy-3-oxopropionate reductase